MKDLAANTVENVEFKSFPPISPWPRFTLRDGERRLTAREEHFSTNHICKWFPDLNLNYIEEEEGEGRCQTLV